MSWRYLAVATEAVLRAGPHPAERYASGVAVEYKGEIDLVTEVDRACELAILEAIRSRYPSHDIVTEETDLARTGSRHVWFIDPLDGTVELRALLPVLLRLGGARARRRDRGGGRLRPAARRALHRRRRAAGAHLNGRPLRVSTAREPPDREPRSSPASRTTCTRSSRSACARSTGVMGMARAVRRDGSAALDLCYVAAGRADGFWEEILKPWDMHAGRLIVEEAGGRSTRLDGTPLGLGPDGMRRDERPHPRRARRGVTRGEARARVAAGLGRIRGIIASQAPAPGW